jgi:hypothetical protein
MQRFVEFAPYDPKENQFVVTSVDSGFSKEDIAENLLLNPADIQATGQSFGLQQCKVRQRLLEVINYLEKYPYRLVKLLFAKTNRF